MKVMLSYTNKAAAHEVTAGTSLQVAQARHGGATHINVLVTSAELGFRH